MNILVVYIIVQLFRAQGWNLATFGLFGIGESKLTKKDIEVLPFYQNPALIPFFWNFILNQVLVIVYANVEINSRVASTNPVYYWAFAQLLNDFQQGKLSRGGKIMAFLMSFHNLLYMSLNFILFPVEIGFV